MSAGSTLNHRPDIDGLRAIAVGSVVLYHCGFARLLPGGFIGVDIFFVISGFLITGIVSSDIEKGRFSLIDFYNRRVRRIFPALFCVYAFVFVAAFMTLMPSEVGTVTRNTISSLLFVSNIQFYSQSGYFDISSEFNALLHTWSLSVEEQFYVILPIALYFLRSLPRKRIVALIAVALLASLAASAWMVTEDQSAAFYLVQYRAWELMIGSLLAIAAVPKAQTPQFANILGLVGIALIAGSLLALNSATPFPGLAAVPVCVGTGLILYSGAAIPTIVGRALSLPPLRFVGLVSYSLYLWHWPVWVFGQQIHEAHGVVDKLLYIAASFGLAVLSWQFIEKPFRHKPYRTAPVRVLVNAACGMTAVLAIALFLQPFAQMYWQVPQRVQQVAAFVGYDPNKSYRTGQCFLTSLYNQFSMFKVDPCLDLSETKPNYVLIGDSNAAHMYPGLAADGPQANILQATASGCTPISGSHGDNRCTDLVAFMFDKFLPEHHVDTIILSALWSDKDLPGLLRAIEKLKAYAARVVVLGPIVRYDIALPRVLAKSLYAGDPTIPARYRQPGPLETDRLFSAEIPASGAEYISIYNAICPDGNCTLWTSDNNPIQFDYGHLTEEGSVLVMSRVAAAIFRQSHAQVSSTTAN